MIPADLAKFEPRRRYATRVALAIEDMATATDEIINLHDRIPGKLFNAAKQNGISGAINSNGLIVHFRLRQNKYC